MQIETQIPKKLKKKLVGFLQEFRDVFAWSHENMPGIDPSIMVHKLRVNPELTPVAQKRQSFNIEIYAIINEEVEKLFKVGFIHVAIYPLWIANIILVRKRNEKWRVCEDYVDHNKACLKDSFPIPRIDQLVDATTGHEMLTFIDVYSGYNQICMSLEDEDKTSYVTD